MTTSRYGQLGIRITRVYLLIHFFGKGDQRDDHDSGRSVESSYLTKLGVLYHNCPSVTSVDQIAKDRSYKNRDEITVSPEKMGAVYEDKVKMFFHEHLHEDEEIRYILDGEGFFDVRSEGDDDWVRIRLEKDDLIILPAGIYHRFTTDSKNVGFSIIDDLLMPHAKSVTVHQGDEAFQGGAEVDAFEQRLSG